MRDVHPALRNLYSERKRKPRELWISNIVFCQRFEFLNYIFGSSSKITDSTLAGAYLHTLIQSYLEKNGYEIEKKVEIDIGDEWKLVGRADAVKDVVIEIKTTNNYHDVKDYWIAQANIYAYILNRPKFEIFVIDKNTGCYSTYRFRTNDHLAKKTIAAAINVKNCIMENKPPTGRKDLCINYCEFGSLCKHFVE